MYHYGYQKFCKDHPESFCYDSTKSEYRLESTATKEAKKVYREYKFNEWLMKYFGGGFV